MVKNLQLCFCAAPQHQAAAWFLVGQDAGAWLDELSGCGLARADTRLYVVPCSLADRTPAGLLAIPAAGVRPLRTPAGLACGVLAGGVYLPVDARLSPAVDEAELRALCRLPVLFLHPVFGVSGFETAAEHHVWDFLIPPNQQPMDWNHARPGPTPPARLQAISFVKQPRLEDLFGAAGQEIGSATDQPMPPVPGEPKEDAASNARRRLRKVTAEWLRKLAARLRHPGGPSRPDNPLERWADQLLSRVRSDLERIRNKELHRLLHLLDHDPDAGLRHAIPLDDASHRGVGAPAARLVPHSAEYDPGQLGGQAGDPWHIPPDIQAQLHRKYRDLALRELRLGHFRRAAYIFASLLGDLSAAASALQQGRHYREAAFLYLEKLQNPVQAALCLAEGGLLREAIEIYEKHNRLLEAAALYERLGEVEQARATLRRVVDQRLAASDWIRAASLLSERLHEPDEALAVLERGWPSSPQAVACLRAQFDLLGRLGRHEAARLRVAELGSMPRPTHLVLPLTQMLTDHAASYPHHGLRQDCADLALRIASQQLSSDQLPSADAASFVALLVRLAPGDRLLARDGQRHLAGRPGVAPQTRRHSPAARPSEWMNPARVRSFRLPDSIRWLSVCLVAPFFFAAGIAGRRLTLVRGTFRGDLQSVGWDLPESEGTGQLLLAAEAPAQDPGVAVVVPFCRLAQQQFPQTDTFPSVYSPSGTPPWLPPKTLGLAFAGQNAWTVHLVMTRYVVTCWTLGGSVVWTDDITKWLCPKEEDAPAAQVSLAAHPAGAVVTRGRQLVLVRPSGSVSSWELPRPAVRLAPANTQKFGGAIALLEWGAIMHWMGCDDLISLDQDKRSPHGAYLPGGGIVLVSGHSGKLLAFDSRHVVAEHPFTIISGPVIGVLPTERHGFFAVFYEDGQVECFRAVA